MADSRVREAMAQAESIADTIAFQVNEAYRGLMTARLGIEDARPAVEQALRAPGVSGTGSLSDPGSAEAKGMRAIGFSAAIVALIAATSAWAQSPLGVESYQIAWISNL